MWFFKKKPERSKLVTDYIQKIKKDSFDDGYCEGYETGYQHAKESLGGESNPIDVLMPRHEDFRNYFTGEKNDD